MQVTVEQLTPEERLQRGRQPLVSVVIPAHNAGRFIRDTVESALNQTYPHLEVLVVDDGSEERVEWLAAAHPDRVRYYWKPQGGPASARNLGIRQSAGELIAFLDADDLWEPEKLALQVQAFAEHPDAGLVYTSESRIDEQGHPLPTPAWTLSLPSGRIFWKLFMRNFVPTSSVMVRRSCLDAVGLFDESKDLVSVEDYDLWLRVTARYDAVCIQKPLLRYRVNASGISRNTARSYAGEHRVITRAVARGLPAPPATARLLPQRFAQLFFDWGYEYFEAGRLAEARVQFRMSLQYRPTAWRVWGYWGSTWLGLQGVERLRQAKQRGLAGLLEKPKSSAVLVTESVPPRTVIQVLHVLNTLETGGAELVVLNLARRLDHWRYAMQVCSLGPEGPLADAFRKLGVRVHALNRGSGVDPMLSLRLAALIRWERIDVVHTHNAGPWVYGGLAAKLARVTLCHTEHSNLFAEQRALMRAERWIARWTDVVIADSEKVKRRLVERQGLDAKNIRVVVNGIDTERFGQSTDVAGVRRALNLNGASPIVATVGRLVPVKDHHTLLVAFQRVAREYPTARLLMVGEGPLRSELERAAEAMGLGAHVLFLRERADVSDILQVVDVFVLSSVSEGMPLTVLEAMAAGKPVVATDVGGVGEAVVQRQTGLLVPPGDPARLAEAIVELLGDEARRRALGENGQARARQLFDLDRMVEGYASAYRHESVPQLA